MTRKIHLPSLSLFVAHHRREPVLNTETCLTRAYQEVQNVGGRLGNKNDFDFWASNTHFLPTDSDVREIIFPEADFLDYPFRDPCYRSLIATPRGWRRHWRNKGTLLTSEHQIALVNS